MNISKSRKGSERLTESETTNQTGMINLANQETDSVLQTFQFGPKPLDLIQEGQSRSWSRRENGLPTQTNSPLHSCYNYTMRLQNSDISKFVQNHITIL